MSRFQHQLYERDDDLAHCKVCGGAEGSLPTLCPGVGMTAVQEQAVYAGELDFNDSAMTTPAWWVPAGREAATPEGMVIAPHFRGFAALGTGQYLLTICEADGMPELVISVATEEEKAGRTVGDLGDVVAGAPIPTDRIAVRLRVASERGLFALEQQLRMLREGHFPTPSENRE